MGSRRLGNAAQLLVVSALLAGLSPPLIVLADQLPPPTPAVLQGGATLFSPSISVSWQAVAGAAAYRAQLSLVAGTYEGKPGVLTTGTV